MKAIYILIISFSFLLSCKKTNEKLIIGTWKVENVEYAADGVNYVDDKESCMIDDIWTFNKNNELEVNQGLICGGNAAPKTTWSLKDEDKTIAYVYEGFVGEYYSTIIELTKKTFIEEFETGQVNGSKIRTTFSKY